MHHRRFIDASLRKVGAALVAVGLVLFWWQTAVAQQDSGALQLRKAELEVEKLQLEVIKLKRESDWPKWLTAFLPGLVTGIAGTAVSVWLARRARVGAMDQATHEKRLECYPQLVKATSRLAVIRSSVSI
jgi:hypothetical protein